MIIVLDNHEILIWGIPPLSPHPPDFLNDNPTRISPLLKTSLPDGIGTYSRICWETILDWYAGSSQLIHLGVSAESLYSMILNVEIVIKPDLSAIFLYVIKTCPVTHGLLNIFYPRYHILEDHTHVSEVHVDNCNKSYIYIRSTSSRPPNIISPESPIFLRLSIPGFGHYSTSTSCPASGRFVYGNFLDIVVVDFLE